MSEQNPAEEYGKDSIKHLEDMEHIRLRPGMYIGKLGDGSHTDDGIYVLIKEVLDNAIDEYRMKYGTTVELTLKDGVVSVRDYGRGIPLEAMVEAVSRLNTGAKYDSQAFKKSVGLNGVGSKAVNALSWKFTVQAYRNGKTRRADFRCGKLEKDSGIIDTDEKRNGTYIAFEPDNRLFENYAFREDYIESMLKNYAYLNSGLTINFNGRKFYSKNGLLDLLTEAITEQSLYPIAHFKGEDIEIAFTHTDQNGEEFHSFVNGQHTSQGGTHQAAFRESIAKTIKEFYNKDQEYSDIRNGIVAAVAINVTEPVFESQTKIKLGSKDVQPGGPTVAKFIGDFVKKEVDDYLHKNSEVAEILLQKIKNSEEERKAVQNISKTEKAKLKRLMINNDKLRDCRIHLNDAKGDRREESSIFITEGNSASGSITKSRDVNTQAVFSLRGKPLNVYSVKPQDVHKNKEFAQLKAALNVEDGIENLRYNKIIVATDADVDGMHIRLLLMTFFLKYYPELIKKGHVFILQTPLFRVQNRKSKIKGYKEPETASSEKNAKKKRKGDDYVKRYCYSDEEREAAIELLGPNPEITRFKGLGEISADEFADFIGEDIRLDEVTLRKEDAVSDLLTFYMGKNTAERQQFIIDNLVVETDKVD